MTSKNHRVAITYRGQEISYDPRKDAWTCELHQRPYPYLAEVKRRIDEILGPPTAPQGIRGFLVENCELKEALIASVESRTGTVRYALASNPGVVLRTHIRGAVPVEKEGRLEAVLAAQELTLANVAADKGQQEARQALRRHCNAHAVTGAKVLAQTRPKGHDPKPCTLPDGSESLIASWRGLDLILDPKTGHWVNEERDVAGMSLKEAKRDLDDVLIDEPFEPIAVLARAEAEFGTIVLKKVIGFKTYRNPYGHRHSPVYDGEPTVVMTGADHAVGELNGDPVKDSPKLRELVRACVEANLKVDATRGASSHAWTKVMEDALADFKEMEARAPTAEAA